MNDQRCESIHSRSDGDETLTCTPGRGRSPRNHLDTKGREKLGPSKDPPQSTGDGIKGGRVGQKCRIEGEDDLGIQVHSRPYTNQPSDYETQNANVDQSGGSEIMHH